MRVALETDRLGAGLLLMLSAAALYLACRAALDVLSRPDGRDAGRRAAGQWLPVAATAVAAVLSGHPEIATAVIFATSVADLSLVLGLAVTLAPAEPHDPRPPAPPPASQRAWPFVLPAALLALVGGFTAYLSWSHALAMLLLGAVVLAVWREGSEAAATPAWASERASRPRAAHAAQLVLAVVLAGVGAWAAVRGSVVASAASQRVSTGAIATLVLGPLLVLPALGNASTLAHHGAAGDGAAALIGTVLLNLCLLLPLSIVLWYAVSGWPALHGAATAGAALGAFIEHASPLPYAVETWRLENVILVVIGFLLVPVGLGRLPLGRLEALLLVVGYFIYLATAWVMGR